MTNQNKMVILVPMKIQYTKNEIAALRADAKRSVYNADPSCRLNATQRKHLKTALAKIQKERKRRAKRNIA